GGDGTRRPARGVPLSDRVLLDPAALLGPGAAQAEGLRPRGRANGAAGVGRARDEAADVVVHADSHSAHGAAGGVRGPRRGVSHLCPGARRAVRGRRGAGDASGGVDEAGVAVVQVLTLVLGSVICGDGGGSGDATSYDGAHELKGLEREVAA